MKRTYLLLILIVILLGCNKEKQETTTLLSNLTDTSPSIIGKKEYLNSPMVTAGDRVYMVGHQDGSFPPLGWHIKGEMGGIWNHPIKLMDGFDIRLIIDNDTLLLNKADSFTNYPFANKHNFSWPEKKLEIERWQFVPDGKEGIYIQLVIKNMGAKLKGKIDFIGHSDLRPTWLGERTQMIDGKDTARFNMDEGTWVVKDENNPWYTVFGSQLEFDQASEGIPFSTKGTTSSNIIRDVLSLISNQTQTINYSIAGSYTSENDAIATYQSIQQEFITDFSAKQKRYEGLANRTKLTIPDKEIQEAFEWVKYNCDWMVRTVPEIGSGIGAGIPDYPWWFGVDSEYALQGYMAMGQHQPVYNTIRLLDSMSTITNGNGRIIHEMSTNGAVFNPGNINETPQFASLIWKIYQWNGDDSFLETYFPTIEKGLDWLLKENDANNNLFPDGYGMMEVHGMDSEMIDVAVYSQQGFSDAAQMASILGKNDLASKYEALSITLKEKINTEFWNEEFGSYADFIGSDVQALQLIEDAIVRADTLQKPWSVSELEQAKQKIRAQPSSENRPFVLHHNWVVNTPMEMGIAPREKALKALKTAEQFRNPFGVFVTGIDRDASAGSDKSTFKGSEVFSYTGAVMTLPTGVQIIAENNYGRPDEALNYLKRMTRTFSYALPGSIYEVSPDYGMISQAWNSYAYAVPIVTQFFGIQPDAANKKIVIRPQMPSEWDTGSLENVMIGSNEISMYYSKTEEGTTVNVIQAQDWTVEIKFPKQENNTLKFLKGEGTTSEEDHHYSVSSEEKEIEVKISH